MLFLIALSAAAILLGLADPLGWGWGAIVAIAGLFCLFVFGVVLLYRHYAHRYHVEDGRIEHQVGIIGRHIRCVRLADLRNVNLRQGIVERMLGIGTLEFSSAGGSGIEVSWSGVRDPADLKRRIESLRGR
jgi:membrane protein YdbS with pleckstrin-like domain